MEKTKYWRNLSIFFILTFLISWLLWLPSFIDNISDNSVSNFLLLLGQFAPFGPLIAAIIVLGITEKKSSIRNLFKAAWNWKFNKRWLLLVIGLPFALTILSYLAIVFIQGVEFKVALYMPIYILIFFMLVSGPFEEFGWRGYALPKLMKKFNPIISTLIIGFIWGLWHLPLHYMAGTVQSSIPFWQFILVTMEGAFIYTYLFKKTNCNLTVMILFHYFSNFATVFEYFQTGLGRYIFFGLQFLVIIYLIVKEKAFWLNKTGA